ncbi:MAG: GNAT family N-acetyltransferase [Acidobacteriaceae bacterium]
MSCIIRPLAAEDLDSILAIAAASREAPLWKRPDYALFVAGTPRPNPHLLRAGLVAQAGSATAPVLGFACATLLRDGQENRAELDTLAVLPTLRRRGIGAALLGAVFSWAAAEGARRIALEVRASNAAALGLYRRLGFCPDGRRPGYYSDPEEDALLLGREITPASPCQPISTENSVEGVPPQC